MFPIFYFLLDTVTFFWGKKMVVFSLEKGPCNYQDFSGLYQLSCILSLSKKGIRVPEREKEKERNQGPKIKNWELPTLGEWGCTLNPRTRGKLRQTLQTKLKKILWFQRLRCNLYISLSLLFFFFFFFIFCWEESCTKEFWRWITTY